MLLQRSKVATPSRSSLDRVDPFMSVVLRHRASSDRRGGVYPCELPTSYNATQRRRAMGGYPARERSPSCIEQNVAQKRNRPTGGAG